ncbi:phosphatase PAP2 family protein [Clostridium sp. MB40-C1]|uniref:phosphatase PAP2 family protein n=1 Tax=Clostridium sp. MB40-C1 TaxID=3070996 RepID=UPI0027E107D3|nr:phosphatase PAP2 family protein [Clostridium sp. MB40-C1]WMJ79098.1 phosphatase PAP2 family protein [Clostridium sp. MB40-C1]
MSDFLTSEINLKIIKYFQSFSNPVLDKLAEFITMMGEEYFFILVIAIIFWCINKKFGYRLGFTLISSMIFNGGIKEALKVPRVFGTEGIRSLRIETATGYSFPSGHTQGITTFWACMMSNIKRKWTYILGTVIIILVAFSRIYLGVHRPIDIIGGFIFALIWVIIANKIFDYLEDGGSKTTLLIIIIPIVIGLHFFKSHDYYTASGTVVGLSIGYAIESKYIKFKEKGNLIQNILKLIIGITIVLVFKSVLKIILPQHLIFDFVRYTFIGLWMTVGAPWLFIKLKLCLASYRIF